jgi:hypothetical protein
VKGFAILTTKTGEEPNRKVFKSLQKGVARIGWSWLPSLDLRMLKEKEHEGGLSEEESKAWRRSNIFLNVVSKGDLLFYRNQPEQGLVTIVKVTGDYEYRRSDDDFWSRRQCKPVRLAFPLADIPDALRRHLNIRGRLNEIRDEPAVVRFYKKITGKTPRGQTKPSKGSSRRGQRAPTAGHVTSYLRPEKEVVVRQRHRAYAKALDLFLRNRGITAAFEKNHVDVTFVANSRHFLGEIKVTNPPDAKDAFRMALGQLFEYRHLHLSKALPIMFNDHKLDQQRLELATELGVAVVHGHRREFVLQNPEVNADLDALFSHPSK